VNEIEELFERTIGKQARTRAPSAALEDSKVNLDAISSRYKSTFSSFSADSVDDRIEESKIAGSAKQKAANEGPVPTMAKINETDFLNTF
jgi:hypothetical protein